MNLLAFITLASAAALAPQGPPMTEPPPRMVARPAGEARQDRTARPPAMGQSTRAIMMPGQDMPRPAQGAPTTPRQPAPRPPS